MYTQEQVDARAWAVDSGYLESVSRPFEPFPTWLREKAVVFCPPDTKGRVRVILLPRYRGSVEVPDGED